MSELLQKINELPSNSHLGILGAGQTGLGLVGLLNKVGAKVSIFDDNDLSGLNLGEHQVFDCSSLENFKEKLAVDPPKLVLRSPGVSNQSKYYNLLKERGIPVYSELDFSLCFLPRPLAAVSGTNGKTTVSTLLSKTLSTVSGHVILAGNSGTAVSTLLRAKASANPNDSLFQNLIPAQENIDLVLEVSSYQLAQSEMLSPRVSVLLNVKPDHLSWHQTFENYLSAKAKIFLGADTEGLYAIVDTESAENNVVSEALKSSKRKVFSLSSEVLGEQEVVLKLSETEERYSLKDCRLIGQHNRLNLAFVILASRILGVEKDKLQALIPNLSPVPHRLEILKSTDGVCYINDSKATNQDATLAALEAVAEIKHSQAVWVLLGGEAKGDDFSRLSRAMQQRGFRGVCFGESSSLIAKQLDVDTLFSESATLKGAMSLLKSWLRPGDIVLLSPACASFDAYLNFEARGEDFKSLVNTPS